MIHHVGQFSVDSKGAYLTKLVDSSGAPILFEQTEIDGKRRGGAHVCLPYFGPDAAGVLPQHGFGRDVEWKVRVTGDSEILCIYEETESSLFGGLHASLTYKLDEGNSLTASLVVENRGKLPFPVAPGFHPYFAVDPSDVRLNGEPINLADFEPFQSFPDREEMKLESAGRTITVSSDDLRHMIVWSDSRGDYLCVEPTLSGPGFDSTNPTGAVLQTGESASYAYSISWS